MIHKNDGGGFLNIRRGFGFLFLPKAQQCNW